MWKAFFANSMKPKRKPKGSPQKNSAIKQKALTALCSAIKKSKTIFVASHEVPEGDALGSTLALGLGLKKLGKKVRLYNVDRVPQYLSFLPGTKDLVSKLDENEKFDLAIMVDVGNKRRVGQKFLQHKNFKRIVCIDHHLVSDHEGEINFVCPNASSTGVMVYAVLKKLGFKKIPKDIATNIYCTIITDTGGFRFSNTNEEALSISTELVRSGVDAWGVARHCFENNPVSRIELLKRVLATLEFFKDSRLASISILARDLSETNSSPEHSEGFIDYPRSVSGVEVAVSFRELAPNKCKVSLRSNTKFSVAQFASLYGGGGHAKAAGFEIEGETGAIRQKIVSHLEALLSK